VQRILGGDAEPQRCERLVGALLRERDLAVQRVERDVEQRARRVQILDRVAASWEGVAA